MLNNKFYTPENHQTYEFFALGEFELERGGSIPNCQLAYATLGKLNHDKGLISEQQYRTKVEQILEDL